MLPSIEPRGSSRPSIQLKNFTDREPQREILARLLSLQPGQPLPVLHFYGVGGIGKSWLLELWRRSINDPAWLKLTLYPHIPVGFINLEKAGLDEAANLNRVRTEFAAVPCPRFDTAYAWLQFRQKLKAEPGVSGSIIDALGDLMGAAADGVPLAGKVAKWLAKKVKKSLEYTSLEKWLLSQFGQDDFLRLRGLTVDQLYGDHGIDQRQTLATRLRDDLHENLPDHKSDYACRGVLFLDTFETLRRGSSSSIHADMREEWVRDLHSTDGRLLIVSAGQNRLRWDECDADYRDERYMEQHLLGGLSTDDATLFLGKCGVHDAVLRNAVLKASVDVEAEGTETSYHPASLGICADAIQIETKRGIAVDPATFDFPPGDWLQLSTRFLKSLPDDEERAWVQKLALPPRFDETAACAMSSRPDTASEILASGRYSFIRDDEEAGWYLLHGRMREALNRVVQKSAALTKKQTQWRSHWQSRSQKDTDDFAALAWFHRYQLESSVAFDEWKQLCEAKRKALDMATHFELLSWWEPTGLLTAKNLTPVEAGFLNEIGVTFCKATLGSRSANVKIAIGCFTSAQKVATKKCLPKVWAMTQNNLGISYSELPDGDRETNLRFAIDCFKAALTVRTKEAFPRSWAGTQNNLGNAYERLSAGDREANLRAAFNCYEAALTVCTKEAFPQSWAMTQNNLGTAYRKLPAKDGGANLRSAIDCFKDVLTVSTKETFPQDWAGTQNNLGNAYAELTYGDREANLRSAIDCFKAALMVHTKEAFPQDWARTQNNMGNAYAKLQPGDNLGTSLRSAMDYFNEALTVFTEETFPQDWAMTQNNLGTAYAKLIDKTGANLRSAINCYKAALIVRTKEAFPLDWAGTQNDLGLSYVNLPDGDRRTNLISAIACFNSSLTVRSKVTFPQDWADTQFNYGLLQIAFANIEDYEKHLQQAETHLVNAELGYTTAGMTMHLPTVREALAQVRAKLAELESESGSES